ncbi:hypothetical protein BU17DRAFT_81395 [Hysterangium stoloniferum]|nr:hypothetical protein BU17DRAFT_81395 [Hysterangium stoloniferum]
MLFVAALTFGATLVQSSPIPETGLIFPRFAETSPQGLAARHDDGEETVNFESDVAWTSLMKKQQEDGCGGRGGRSCN